MSWSLVLVAALQPIGPVASCLAPNIAVERALDGAHELALTQARIAEAQAARSEVRSLWRPQLSAYADSSVGDTGLTGSRLTNQAGLQVSQRLLDWGDASERGRRGDAMVEEARAQGAADAIGLAETVAGLVADYVAARQKTQLFQTSLAYLERRASALEPLLEEGLATRQDMASLRSEIFAKRADLERAQQEVAATWRRLSMRYRLTALPCDEYQSGYAEDAGELRYPEVESARARVAAARSDYRLTGKARLPIIAVTGRASYASTGLGDPWSIREQAGISVSAPIYSGNALAARRRQAAARVAQAEAELSLITAEASADEEVLRERLRSSIIQERLLEATVEELEAQLITDEELIAMGAATLDRALETRRRLDAKAIQHIDIKAQIFTFQRLVEARARQE